MEISSKNLVWSLLFLMFGIILLTNDSDLLSIASNVLGIILIVIGFIKGIIYVYMKGKLGDYSNLELTISLLLIGFGTVLVVFSSALSLTIRLIFGLWCMFAAVNRIVFAINIKKIDKIGFFTYILTALIMMIIGVLIISNLFGNVLGLLIIIYSIVELIDYIYYSVNKNKKNYPKSTKGVKKDGKVVEAIIEE